MFNSDAEPLCSLIEAHKLRVHCSDFKKKYGRNYGSMGQVDNLTEAAKPQDLNSALSEF